MVAMNGFDASSHKPMEQFDPIPAGEYQAIAVDSEEKPTKNGNGSYLQFAWEIIDGEYKGRKLWSRLNLKNPSQEAVEIAERELSSICRAAGVLRPRDSAELHGKPLVLRVGVEKRNDTGELTNKVKGYKSINGNGSAQTSAPTPSPNAPTSAQSAPAPQGPPAMPARPPWRT